MQGNVPNTSSLASIDLHKYSATLNIAETNLTGINSHVTSKILEFAIDCVSSNQTSEH